MSNRDDLQAAIAKSVEVIVARHSDGSYTSRGLDGDTVSRIAGAVIGWLGQFPVENVRADNYSNGLYSRRNIAAMIADIQDY